MTTQITPAEDELKSALLELKSANPTLGISKIHAQLLATHPEWTVSEKRTRKVLQGEGLVNNANGGTPGQLYPSSKLIEGLDVSKYSEKIEVKYFSKIKGKGLVAKEPIKEGETIWKEDPWVLAPEW
ncbi:hypothetical protein NUW54_g7267 [Trametes sanguinea]|uniref:Uncharacterized protein n=1 Tax=Trametes sanguinea TaxID=158606 RepID=A0ACC1PN47_9APHY|nr:hypothetical protein NUW54_g7267 [Trametes sanguinea]